ncbi:hypothetical protein [Mycobacterium sp. E796]|uniref:hypothetical protein n=1 Tax=Mycobacterium sp. E796 TaxID=1834151 RepID=UPI0007FD2A76|nr:hypothetical protein [Mycobacterium sp. E796]OBI40464.1 hypothetical protein A5706_09315 [Mycobacterium sp. E796]
MTTETVDVTESAPKGTEATDRDTSDRNEIAGTADVAAFDGGTGERETSDTPEGDARSDANRKRRIRWVRVLAYGLLPALSLILATGVGYAKWLESSNRQSRLAATESVSTATDDMVALLSYKPDTVDKDLGAARDRLTGDFRNSYTGLIHDVVIPGAKQKQISALANVPAAASISASPSHAVVLVFVNQTVTVGNDPPTNTASSVRVTLDKIGGRWLISQFEPV